MTGWQFIIKLYIQNKVAAPMVMDYESGIQFLFGLNSLLCTLL